LPTDSSTPVVGRVVDSIAIYVVTLDGVTGAAEENTGRFEEFTDRWRRVCGVDLQVNRCPGRIHETRGVGLTLAFTECLLHAYSDLDTNADVVVFFEDDADLFDADFCSLEYQKDLFASAPSDALVMLLGAHDFKLHADNVVEETDSQANEFIRVRRSWGSYGFAVYSECK
jgi:hypothetical protein